MLFSLVSLLAATSAVSATSSSTSSSIGSVVVQPLDYDTYGTSIDYQLLRYLTTGDVFFYTKSVTTVSNETQTVKNAYVLDDGQFSVDSDGSYFLAIDSTSGIVSVTDDNTTSDGIFYIDDSILYYEYHSTFIACQGGESATNYTLIWRGASSPAECENDWLLVHIQTYASSSGEVSAYYPNNYASDVASTATENTATTTATIASTTASSSSTGAAAKASVAGAVGLIGAVIGWLL